MAGKYLRVGFEDRGKSAVSEYVRSMSLDDLKNESFFIVHANTYCRGSDGFVPCEVAVAKFSYKCGVKNAIHSIIDPGVIPSGFCYEADRHSEDSHRIPLPPHDLEAKSVEQAGMLILQFARDREGNLPSFYTASRELEEVEDVLRRLVGDAGNVCVLPLQYLLIETWRASAGGSVVEAEATRDFDRDRYDMSPFISCEYHEEKDSRQFCSLSAVRRWGFLCAERCCPALGIDMVEGRHYPPTKAHHASLRAAPPSPVTSSRKQANPITFIDHNEKKVVQVVTAAKKTRDGTPMSKWLEVPECEGVKKDGDATSSMKARCAEPLASISEAPCNEGEPEKGGQTPGRRRTRGVSATPKAPDAVLAAMEATAARTAAPVASATRTTSHAVCDREEGSSTCLREHKMLGLKAETSLLKQVSAGRGKSGYDHLVLKTASSSSHAQENTHLGQKALIKRPGESMPQPDPTFMKLVTPPKETENAQEAKENEKTQIESCLFSFPEPAPVVPVVKVPVPVPVPYYKPILGIGQGTQSLQLPNCSVEQLAIQSCAPSSLQLAPSCSGMMRNTGAVKKKMTGAVVGNTTPQALQNFVIEPEYSLLSSTSQEDLQSSDISYTDILYGTSNARRTMGGREPHRLQFAPIHRSPYQIRGPLSTERENLLQSKEAAQSAGTTQRTTLAETSPVWTETLERSVAELNVTPLRDSFRNGFLVYQNTYAGGNLPVPNISDAHVAMRQEQPLKEVLKSTKGANKRDSGPLDAVPEEQRPPRPLMITPSPQREQMPPPGRSPQSKPGTSTAGNLSKCKGRGMGLQIKKV